MDDDITKGERYLAALKTMEGWVLVSEWAERVGELFPEILSVANHQAANQARATTGLREIAARIGSRIARGRYAGQIEIDESQRPRRVRFVSDQPYDEETDEEIRQDVADVTRAELVKQHRDALSQLERYRLDEFEHIAKQLKAINGIELEIDHAAALLNPSAAGKHHPDNLQLLLKAHNAKKHNENWPRFSIDEQLKYIQAVVRVHELVGDRFGTQADLAVVDALMERLKRVY